MSEQENLAIVQNSYAAFGRGDVAGAISNYANDIDWAMPGSPEIIPYAGKRRGREQVAQFYSTFAG
jgi:ketosteroid isomerase-like protein